MIGTVLPRVSVLALGLAMMSGCAGTNSASSPWYQSPAGLTPANGATLVKSDNQAGGTVPDGDTRFVTVDGQPVSAMEWDKVLVPPGPHSLGVTYNGLTAIASVEIQATLRPGDTYAVKAQRTGPCDADLWLEDQRSHQAASAKLEAHLSAKPSQFGSSVFAAACD
jgi:hypothetical protein